MARISATKKDSIPRIVEKILESEEKDIVLSVSSSPAFEKTLANFELIKREADAAGKIVSIASADDEIVGLAEKAGIPIAGSQTRETEGSRMMSDIIPMRSGAKKNVEKIPSPAPHKHEVIEPEEVNIEEPKHTVSFWEKAEEESESKRKFTGEVSEIKETARQEKHKRKYFPRFKAPRIIIRIISFIVLLVAAGWAGGVFWSKAEVALAFKKADWQYKGAVVANKVFSQMDAAKGYLPAEVFQQQKNTTRLFPASGVAQVADKATAKIVIYNAYSSSRQTFVASTRFSTPDGKIFRLDNQVTVPGAVVKDGKITPSSIEASVTADKTGADYNVGPFDKLTILGFRGTPKYEGFYASMPQAASGGFVGQKKVPTDKDIASAKDETTQGLKDALQGVLLSGVPQGFDIIGGASAINVTKLIVNKSTDGSGNFSVFGEASYQAIGFRDEDLQSLLNSLMGKDNPDMEFSGDLKIDYQNVKTDMTAGQLTFAVSASGTLKPRFAENDFKPKIAGKSFNEAKATIMALPHLENAKISIWPFWVGNLPKNISRIKIVLN